MSKVQLSGNASGTGIFTIASPNSNTDRTLTLPDNTGTILTSATTTGFPAGSVLQVVNVQYATQVSTTSTSYVDTGLSASITPSSASSKILVIVSQTITPASSGSNTFCSVRLMRGASQIWYDARVNGIGQYVHTTPSASVLDSPATTSSVTYKTQFATGTGIYAMEAQHADLRISTITLLEIAA
jgi:hypothetical protein